MVIQVVGVDLLERHGAVVVFDEDRSAPEATEPFDDVLRVADTAAQEQELGLRRGESQGEFVIQAAVGVADHLVFIHHQQRRAVAGDEAVLLGF